ncbi:MAG: MBL fold metallo-hydrolase [Lachnospiraceae bacterium]|nr:MBL fold metallo-hydrolase [Lachnospiraceae bacterium]
MRITTLVVGMVGTNCYLVYDDETKRAVIVDPGDGAGQISAECKRLSLKPDAILLTHGHFDHILAAEELRAEWGLKIYACEKELPVLSDGKKNLVQSYYGRPYGLVPDETVKEGDTLSVAGLIFTVLETPGHTAGSCCYYMEKERVLFSGDTLFQMSYGRIDFPTGSGRAMETSVRRLLAELPDDVTVYPGHMDQTTIAFERTYNPLAEK